MREYDVVKGRFPSGNGAMLVMLLPLLRQTLLCLASVASVPLLSLLDGAAFSRRACVLSMESGYEGALSIL
jgi:hypothetical protein